MTRPELTDTIIADMLNYKKPTEISIPKFQAVSEAAEQFLRVIRDNVPNCPDRSVAIRKIREARMDANSAIAHDGAY